MAVPWRLPLTEEGMTVSLSFKDINVKGWLITFLIAGVITWLLYAPGATATNLYWFGTILAIGMFAFSLMPNFVVAVLLLMYYIVTGVAGPDLAFVGWLAPIPWLVMCGMLIGVVMERTGLANRIALLTISRIGTTPVRLFVAFLLAGFALGALIPDIITVDILFMTIASGMCRSLHLENDGRTSSVLILAAFFGVVCSSAAYLPNNTGIIGLLMVKDMGVPFSWLSFFGDNIWFNLWQALVCYGMLYLVGGKNLGLRIAECREHAAEELKAMGGISRNEVKTLILALIALLAFVTEPIHGIPGYFAFCTVVLLGFTPLFNLMENEDISKIQFPILFFIAGCMAIGIVAGQLGIPAWLADKIVPYLRQLDSNAGSSLFAYGTGIVANLVLTPVAAATALSVPMAEIATSLGLGVKPVLYSFLYGLDQFILPYELAPALIMFATGYVKLKYLIPIMVGRIVLCGVGLALVSTFVWPLLGL